MGRYIAELADDRYCEYTMSDPLISGFPVCSYKHAPVNMRLVSVFVHDERKDDETWECPTCEGKFRCLVVTRDVPEVLR